ncbi:nucleotidyltransferase family protein [Lichenibacterium dinghuense]|uniref:nucleotidyltransferase family protein n=1 Tax=Lichenibacterium dinghuense TaxID=2895977 RepID=UPI001F238D58|nr:nucleotidyltransferase family protein [Lichenibacterium sp. 6Y81]
MKAAAVILAAGTASRYRAADPTVATKLVARHGGVPLVRRVAEAALASRARPVVVVTGHAAAEVRAALDGCAVGFVHNADYGTGLASSLRAGLAALPADAAGALVLLGDMPDVTAPLLDRLIGSFEAGRDAEAAVPVHGGRRGNPALLGRALFAPALALTGDEGARRLLGRARVVEVGIDDDGVLLDVDDPASLLAIAGRGT